MTQLHESHLASIAEKFSGRVYAFTAVLADRNYGLGIAEANVAGYTPIPVWFFHVSTFEEASAEAARLNIEHLELNEMAATRIIGSTMAAQNRRKKPVHSIDRAIESALEDGNRALANRLRIERRIVRKVVNDALSAGFVLSVDDGGDEFAVERSSDKAEIMDALMNTDIDRLHLTKPGLAGVVMFVYGNDGWDVISDYSVSLEDQLAGANALAEKLESGAA